MKEYKLLKGRKKLTTLNSIILVFTIIFSFNIFRLSLVNFNLYKSKIMLENEFNNLKKQNDNLKKQISFYNSNKGVEKLARERLNFVKNDEIPIRYIKNISNNFSTQ
jgi:cell division protein FtsB